MDVRTALKEQYHAGLAMLAQCIEKCPDELWTSSNGPDGPVRAFWRIAWHALYFTDNYLAQDVEAFEASAKAWPASISAKLGLHTGRRAVDVEPYELPLEADPVTRAELREYLTYVDGVIDSTVDGLDLAREDSGFPWYPNTSKLSHQLLNLRHIQGHVGQLSELLMARGIDIDWVSQA
ncbi:MAG TPA: DinB family protein [Fimbriimonadaceae bacterium]|nr:DinB family protein [Fimbriimonadaceae bacterium]